MAGSVGRVSSQAAKRIEPFAPELEKIISPSEPIQELAEGFGGALGSSRRAGLVEGRRLPAVQRHS